MDELREKLSPHVRYGKWAGLCGAVMALIAHQQIASSWVYTRCPENPPLLVGTTAAICAFIVIATGAWSWSVRQSLRNDENAHVTPETDRFIASLSAALALVILLFIVFSSVAVLFLRCER
jgi:hypothetical protein